MIDMMKTKLFGFGLFWLFLKEMLLGRVVKELMLNKEWRLYLWTLKD